MNVFCNNCGKKIALEQTKTLTNEQKVGLVSLLFYSLMLGTR